MSTTAQDFRPSYSPWRHGGWYVDNVRYPSGACGCVSRNFSDRKWRVVADNTCAGEPGDRTFPNRDSAAMAEMEDARRGWEIVAGLASFSQYPPETNGRDGRCILCDLRVKAGQGFIVLGSDSTGTYAAHLHPRCADTVREIQQGTRRNPYAAR
jgi:hypothetical protein